MENQPMDPKRLKLLKTAIVKLREVTNILEKVNIDGRYFDIRVLGFRYDHSPLIGECKMTIHIDSLTTLKQLYKGIEPGKPCGEFKEFHHQSGNVKAFCLVKEEEENND